MGSTLMNTYGGGTITLEITKAINQLSANQQSMMTQMAAMSFNNAPVQPPQAAATFHVPPSNSCTFPLLLDRRIPVTMPAQGIMVEIGDAEEDEVADAEVVVGVGEEAVHAHRLQTICETHKWQEDMEEGDLQG
jgi:hypothetical protein